MAFDKSKPSAGSGVVSAEMRDNFNALAAHHYGTTAPSSPELGWVWIDNADAANVKLKVYSQNGVNPAAWVIYVEHLESTPTPANLSSHASTHQNNGADEISVAGLSGALADAQNAGQLQGRDVDSAAPSDTNVLTWSVAANKWAPAAGGGGGGGLMTLVSISADTISLNRPTDPRNPPLVYTLTLKYFTTGFLLTATSGLMFPDDSSAGSTTPIWIWPSASPPTITTPLSIVDVADAIDEDLSSLILNAGSGITGYNTMALIVAVKYGATREHAYLTFGINGVVCTVDIYATL